MPASRNLFQPRNFALIIIVIVVAVGAYIVGHKDSSDSTNSGSQTSTKLVAVQASGLKYPEGWSEASQIPLGDQQAQVVSEASHAEPPATLIIREVPGELDPGFDIKNLPGQTADKLRASQTGFKLLRSSVISIGRHQAASLTYQDTADSGTYEHTQIIVPTAHRSFYMIINAQADDYSVIEKDLKALQASLDNYLATKNL